MITADPRRTSRVGLFVGLLSALLFAILHCTAQLPGEEPVASGTLSATVTVTGALGAPDPGSAAPQHPGHPAPQHPAHPDHPDHHADCLSTGLVPQAQNEPRHPAGAEPALALTPVTGPQSADPAAPPGAGAARPARTGRATLAGVCRWRI
ncbi:hypothetical protein ACFWP3_17260 [Streptomyces sp. NPDC058525]|uniref:hypothetical protein n=1 Tax=unclassified Streptomyces TaxID=2593676 RepID=UPI00364D4297